MPVNGIHAIQLWNITCDMGVHTAIPTPAFPTPVVAVHFWPIQALSD